MEVEAETEEGGDVSAEPSVAGGGAAMTSSLITLI